jgi:cellulose synthase/poly-beta-1,6-N-acetylglucosamine synthase-like glycosyltransferase
MDVLEVMRWGGYVILTYFVLLQAYILYLGIHSALVMRRNHHLDRFARSTDMLSSSRTPPISIVIPAYNESQGIVDAVRSMSIVGYPRFEIVVVNDGSKDDTLDLLIQGFELEKVRVPYRPDIPTQPVRAIYRSTGPINLTVLDKENGGRADALNAGTNVARYPYALFTDADVVLEANCLTRAMRRVIEDRETTIGVGGNIRPLNGSKVELGHLISASAPAAFVPRFQIIEYMRTFMASRPAWSALEALPLVSGAFGIWRRSAVIEIGGFAAGHLGEDMDLTMRMHRHHIENEIPYRIVYEPSAVIWTEVPQNSRVLKRQRIRWHRGLMAVVRDNIHVTFNPRYGRLGMITWPGMFLFEYVAPIVEFVGWLLIPLAAFLGALNVTAMLGLLALAWGMGLTNSLMSILLDESFGHYNSVRDITRLVTAALIENIGFRQMTVAWRIRALFGGKATKAWGNMERQGVANLSAETP